MNSTKNNSHNTTKSLLDFDKIVQVSSVIQNMVFTEVVKKMVKKLVGRHCLGIVSSLNVVNSP